MRDKNDEILFSVIMPTYNRAYVISKAIESVIKQSMSSWELYVIDDGSTDDTAKIFDKEIDKRVHYICLNENSGACHARNMGLSAAVGKYCAFLDSDNCWDPDYLRHRAEIFAEKKCDVIIGYAEIKHEDGKSIIWPPYWYGSKVNKSTSYLGEKLFSLCPSDLNSMCIKRECYLEYGGFDEAMKCAQDWDIFSKYIINGASYYFDEAILVKGEIQKNSISNIDPYSRWKSYYRLFLKNKEYLIKNGIMVDSVISLLQRPDIKTVNRADMEADLADLLEGDLASIIDKVRISVKKANQYYDLATRWISLKQKGINISDFFVKNGAKNVAIYGMRELGVLLCEEMKSTSITLLYVIDKDSSINCEYPLVSPNDALPDVDMIVVTAFFYFEEIKEILVSKSKAKIVSLSEVIQDMESSYNN